MPFNSYQFIFLFLPITIIGFWLITRKIGGRSGLTWLLLASIVFYAYASPMGLVIITPSVLLDYHLAKIIMRTTSTGERTRRLAFMLGIGTNIALLGYFKYKNFFLDTANGLLGAHFVLTPLTLLLGISFITFQKLSFLADVRSGHIRELRLFDFLLFIFFFPRVVSGPLVRYQEFVPQLRERPSCSFASNVTVAICLFSLGLFKKAVIADSIAQFVPPAFDDFASGETLDFVTAWPGVLAFNFQLYFDFSGYSDMALGLARIFGVRLPMNFNSPFKASSIVEFWRRWHISLTRFLTDYIYTPIVLHLTRVRLSRSIPVLRRDRSSASAVMVLIALPTMLTMIVSGFWHGAGWQFVIFGSLHGCYLTINQTWRLFRKRFWPDPVSYARVMRPVGFVLTFVSVLVAFVFFRAPDVRTALAILTAMIGTNGFVVLPHDAQLLRHLGVTFPPTTLWDFASQFWWPLCLFLGVTLLPNSLELLRKFDPALDFQDENRADPRTMSQSPDHVVDKYKRRMLRRLRTAYGALRSIGRDGIQLNRTTATIAALLWVLGVLSLNRGGGFIYWKF